MFIVPVIVRIGHVPARVGRRFLLAAPAADVLPADRWCDVAIPDCHSASLHCESIAVRIIAYSQLSHFLEVRPKNKFLSTCMSNWSPLPVYRSAFHH